MNKRNRIFGLVGIVWGLAILVKAAVDGLDGSGSYRTGQVIALVIAVAMVGAGAYALSKVRRG